MPQGLTFFWGEVLEVETVGFLWKQKNLNQVNYVAYCSLCIVNCYMKYTIYSNLKCMFGYIDGRNAKSTYNYFLMQMIPPNINILKLSLKKGQTQYYMLTRWIH